MYLKLYSFQQTTSPMCRVEAIQSVILPFKLKMAGFHNSSVSPRINEKGGDLAGARSIKLYLGAWCMHIHTPFIV